MTINLNTKLLLTSLVAGTLTLTACQNSAETNETETAQEVTTQEVATEQATTEQAEPQQTTELATFACEPSIDIKAQYDVATENQDPVAHVFIDGTEYVMDITPSASGEIYKTETGLTEGNGLIWSVKGKDAILESFDLNNPTDNTSMTTVASCLQQ